MSSTPPPAAAALLPGDLSLLLHHLDSAPPQSQAAAEEAMRHPQLCLALLRAAPLQGDEADLRAALARRLQDAGADVLRAWQLLSVDSPTLSQACQRQALMTAECARHLAIESAYPRPDDAFLCGLLRELGHSGSSTLRDGAMNAAGLARACGAAQPLIDALELEAALDEHISNAHPLTALLWSAVRLGASAEAAEDPRLGALTALPAGTLLALRTDVAFLAGNLPTAPAEAPPASVQMPAALQYAALRGLLRGALGDCDGAAALRRLRYGSALVFGLPAPLLLTTGTDGHLLPPALDDHPASRWITELGLRGDDERSIIALAARSGTATRIRIGDEAPRCPQDWQLARWLQAPGIACLPLPPLGSGPCVAVLPQYGDAALPTSGVQAAFAAFAAQALSVLEQETSRRAALEAVRNELESSQRARARALIHEASNPLTVIRSYLGLVEQRNAADTALLAELAIIGDELDRVAELVQRFASPPGTGGEHGETCDPGAILDELDRLCASALFGCRDIRFDVRKPATLPRLAMPGGVLRQILLNLYRNAAEALPPGGRFAVAVAGPLLVDGRQCLELRLVDNGPGLPPARIDDLFGKHPSDKGRAHAGIGLSIVGELLAQWHATLVCRSQPTLGTSYQILIPLENTPKSATLR